MVVICEKCKRYFDDKFRSWVCPHKKLSGEDYEEINPS